MKCQANAECTSEAAKHVTVEQEPIDRLSCCPCCASYLNSYWSRRGRRVVVVDIENLRREWN